MSNFKQLLTTGAKLANELKDGAGQYTGKVTSGIGGLIDQAGKGADDLASAISKGGFTMGSVRDAVYGAIGISQKTTDKTNPLGILNQGPVRAALTSLSAPYTGNKPYEILTFPFDLDETYSMTISFGEYQRKQISQPKIIKPLYAIVLPLPDRIQDNTGVQFNQVDLGTFAKPAMEYIGKLVGSYDKAGGGEAGGGAVWDELKKLGLKDAQEGLKAFAQVGMRGAIGGISDTLGGNLDRFIGNIANPNMSVVFGGVDLRTHTWTWRLIPRTHEESGAIRDMIKRVKMSSLPNKEREFFLGYPNIANIKLNVRPSGEELVMYKTSFLSEFNVDYAPTTQAFHNDKHPVEYQITMTFKEIEIFTREDYETGRDQLNKNSPYGLGNDMN